MSDYLPPAVLKLVSEFDPKGTIEAKRALADLKADSERALAEQVPVFGAEGEAAGKAYGEGVSKGVQPGLDKVRTSSQKTEKQLSGLAAAFELAKTKGDWFARVASGDAKAVDFLTEHLEKLRKEAEQVAVQFNRTGNVSLLDRLLSIQSSSKTLTKLRDDITKTMGDAGKDSGKNFNLSFGGVLKTLFSASTFKGLFTGWSKAGIEAGSVFEEGFMGVLKGIGKAAWPVLVPMAIGIASWLLAAIGGVIQGASGLGLIIGGAIAQIKSDPQVQAAAKGLGSWLSQSFKADTAPLAQPLIDAFSILQTKLSGPLSDLQSAFAYIAPYVRDFAASLGEAVQKFLPGFLRMIKQSGPVITELGKDVGIVADGFSKMFDQIGKGSKGEVESLRTLAAVIAGTVTFIGYLIRGGAKVVEWLTEFDKVIGSIITHVTPFGALMDHLIGLNKYMDEISGAFDNSGSHIDGMARKLDTTTQAIDAQRNAVKSLRDAYDDWFGKSMSVDQAQLTLLNDMSQLTQATKGQKHAFDLSTQAGRDNYGQLLQTIQGAKDLRDAQVAAGMSTQQADAQFQKTYDTLMANAKAAGLTKDQMNQLTVQFGQLKASLNSLNGTDIKIYTHFITEGTPPSQFYHGLAQGGIHGVRYASQGILDAGVYSEGPIVFAEKGTGGEAFIPRKTQNPARAMRILSQAAAWYGQRLTPSGGGPSSAALQSLSRGPMTSAPSDGGYSGGYVPIMVQLGGAHMATVHAQLIPAAQRYKIRTGTTGLS